MCLGDDERVARVDRLDVKKGERVLVFVHDMCRNLFCDDLAEDALFHTKQYIVFRMETSELVRTLLTRRGITEGAEVERFLAPNYERDTHDPSLFSGMDTAVSRILHAMEQGERIAVYSDFDCDGIPGAAVLHDTFAKLGYAHAEVYIPHRDREGYGFHAAAIDTLAARGVSLVITVDVGIGACAEVEHAKRLGVDVIITDHHEILGSLPSAVAVLNPKISPYPFPHLCGAAVAFKLAQALLREGKKRGLPEFLAVPDGWEKWLLDLVAIATVADMVPLIGENRVLAHFGLRVLRKSAREGLRALAGLLRLRLHEATEDDIGFSIAPRVNAASRMDEPELAFRLLTTRDGDEAARIAGELERLNASRKASVASIVREAKKRVRERFFGGERVVVLGDTSWKPALLGLAANSVMEERGGMVCLWGRDANGNLKGSCRSDDSLSVVDVFTAGAQALQAYGGHARSGGFSVSHEQVHTLHEALLDAASTLELSARAVSAEEHDAVLSLSEVSVALLQSLSQLAPFGIGNPKPVFRISGVCVASVRSFGKANDHLELALSCLQTGKGMRAYDFFTCAADMTVPPTPGIHATLLATVERDSFRRSIALRIVDVVGV